MRISDWSSDVCSSDLVFAANLPALPARGQLAVVLEPAQHELRLVGQQLAIEHRRELLAVVVFEFVGLWLDHVVGLCVVTLRHLAARSGPVSTSISGRSSVLIGSRARKMRERPVLIGLSVRCALSHSLQPSLSLRVISVPG